MCMDESSKGSLSVEGGHVGGATYARSQRLWLKNHVRRAFYDSYGMGAHRMMGDVMKTSYEPCAEDYLIP